MCLQCIQAKRKKERNEINQTIQTNRKTWSFLLFVCLFLSMSFNKLSAYSKPLLPMLSHFIPVQLFETPMDYSLPGPSVHGIFPGKKYWHGLPCSPPGDLPNPETEPASPVSPALQTDSLPFSHWRSPVNSNSS